MLTDKMDPVEFFKLTEDMNEKTIKNEKKLARIFSPKKPVVTYILIVLNVMIYLFLTLYDKTGNITFNFSNVRELVKQGEYYRLLTCMFLHANIYHLAFNMYALYVIGPQVEKYYGKTKYLFIYLISGLLGSLFSAVFMGPNTYSLGASGAIFGLLGSVAYFTYYYRATLQGLLRSQVLPVIVLNLVISVMLKSIDLSAHVGGLIGGILISMALGIGDKGRKSDEINGVIVLILLFVFMIYLLFTR